MENTMLVLPMMLIWPRIYVILDPVYGVIA